MQWIEDCAAFSVNALPPFFSPPAKLVEIPSSFAARSPVAETDFFHAYGRRKEAAITPLDSRLLMENNELKPILVVNANIDLVELAPVLIIGLPLNRISVREWYKANTARFKVTMAVGPESAIGKK